MNTLVHIIPTLGNGGAENILTSLVIELNKASINQIVITINGSDNDFNFKRVENICEVISFKENPSKVKKLFSQRSSLKILAWMYSGIFHAHKWNILFNTSHEVIWNIRHSNFGRNQIFQKISLYVFGVFSHLYKNKIIYCSYKSLEVHEKSFFYKLNKRVIVNRLAKKNEDKSRIIKSQDCKYILFVGRFNPQKGPTLLRDIAVVFFQKYPNIELWIAGGNWELTFFPKEIRNRVKILGSVKDIFPIYNSASVLLFTSIFGEGYPNVLVEAASCGIPIVGFNSGDSELILNDYKYGHVVNTTSQFLSKLDKVLQLRISEEEKNKEIKIQLKKMDFNLTVSEYYNFIFQ